MRTMLRFEWDPLKARSNHKKHGVTFEEAKEVFGDPFAYFEPDQGKAAELRWLVIGTVGGTVVLLVVHTVREEGQNEAIRLISARRATRKERQKYGEASAQDAWR
jgi:uncharacterized DUF497 family protein